MTYIQRLQKEEFLSASIEGLASQGIVGVGRVFPAVETRRRGRRSTEEQEIQDEDSIGQLDAAVVIGIR